MNCKLYIFLFITIFVGHDYGIAQEFKKAPMTVCPIDPNSYHTRVHLSRKTSESFQAARINNSSVFKSNFIVNYSGFTEEARIAFQYAVDIWSTLLSSNVDIIVDASFEDLGPGILGSAGASFLVRDFENAPSDTTFYPIALAEKIAGVELNLPVESEITCRFSSTFDFYFGLDGNPPADQFDFVSIVLHELGHGLGFAGVENVDNNSIGSWDYFNNKSGRYNEFVELQDGTPIFSITNNTEELGQILTGDGLFFGGSLAVTSLGSRPKLYAPSTYNAGSSFSHLDETQYPPGNPNSLMSPQFGRGESILDPGVALDIFADMGWFITVIDHTPEYDVLDNYIDDIHIDVTLRSDTNIIVNNLNVVYSVDNFLTSNSIVLIQGINNVFSAKIPNPGQEAVVQYYFDGVEDGLGRMVRSPNSEGSYFKIKVKEIGVAQVPFALNLGDFESSNAGFFSISLDGEINEWERGNPSNVLQTSGTPSNVWKTNLNSDISFDGISYKSALVSPYFNLEDSLANYILSFDLGMEIHENSEGLIFDSGPIGANVEVSLDGGLSWDVLGEINDQAGENWYNFQNNGSGFFGTNTFDNKPGWIIDSVNSVNVKYNISRLSYNDSVAFRIVFHVEADFLEEGYQTDGILIDNFQITKENPTAEFIVKNLNNIFFAGDEVAFEHISSGAESYLWNFGDGASSTLKNPKHIYQTGGLFDVSLTVQSAGGLSDVVLKEKLVAVIIESDPNFTLVDGGDFEVDNGAFLIDNVSGTGFDRGVSSVTGKEGTTSGSVAIVTGLNDSNYIDQSEAFLYTPLFDFTSLGSYEMSFMANYKTEIGWDGFIVEYSSDLGANWLQLEPEVKQGWYDRVGEDNAAQGWPAIPLFTGNSGGFVKKEIDLSKLGGTGRIGFRFHWLSDFAETDVGLAIDDFELSGPISGPGIADFSISDTTGCDGQVVTFVNGSNGTISEMMWDFGLNASPTTASGVGPHEVIYSGEGNSTVTLTITSPVNGESSESKIDIIRTSPTHEPFFTRVNNNDGTYTLTASTGDSYQWFRNGEQLVGETGNTLNVSLGDGGTYYALVTLGSCAIQTSSEIVNHLAVNKTKIYPNPTSSILNINSIEYFNGDYLITTVTGRIIKSGRLQGNEAEIDLSGKDEGIYFLRLTTDSGQEDRVIKFVLRR